MKNLNWQKTLIVMSLILGISIVVASFSPAISQGRPSGYMIAGDGGQFVWRVNTSTGAVSYCVRRDNSVDEKFIAKRPPFCSAQTAPAQ